MGEAELAKIRSVRESNNDRGEQTQDIEAAHSRDQFLATAENAFADEGNTTSLKKLLFRHSSPSAVAMPEEGSEMLELEQPKDAAKMDESAYEGDLEGDMTMVSSENESEAPTPMSLPAAPATPATPQSPGETMKSGQPATATGEQVTAPVSAVENQAEMKRLAQEIKQVAEKLQASQAQLEQIVAKIA